MRSSYRFSFATVAASFLLFLSFHTVRAATITVPAGGSLQAAIDIAQPGDTIVLQAGATYIGNFRLRNKGTSTQYITIRTSNLAGIPAEGVRVNPSHDGAMARVLTPGNGQPLIDTEAGAGYYKLIGLYLGVNYGSDPNREYGSSFLINLANGNDDNPMYGRWLSHHITIDRCHVAGKFGNSRFAVVFNGADLSLINSWVDEFASLGDSCGVWMGVGPGPYTIENNHISAGMWQIFIGGADTDSPNFGTVQSGTASNVTLSDMQGTPPSIGDLVAFRVRELSPTLRPWRANSNYAKGEIFYHHTPWTIANNKPPTMFFVTQAGVSGSTEPDWTNAHENRPLQDGTVVWHFEVTGFQIGRVLAVQGTTLTLEPAMPQGLVLPPVVGSKAKWNGNVPSDILIRRNHFFRPGSWAALNAPNKGMFQFKAGRRVVIEGNYFESEVQYPGLLGLSAGNQGGTAPWTTVSHITFRHNRVRHLGTITNITLSDTFGKTSTPGSDVDFHNNLLTEMGGPAESEGSGFLLLSTANGVRATHNTIVNNHKLLSAYGPPQSGFVMKDNILTYNFHMNCELGEPHFTKCFPGSTVAANAVVNVPSDRRGEFPAGTFFPLTHADVRFANFGGQAVSDWALRSDSPYKGKATDGKDLGVDINALNAAMGGQFAPVPIPTPTPTPSTPTPTPNPTPAPNPTPTPIPTPTPTTSGMTSTLVTAPAGSALMTINTGSTINLATLPTRSLSIKIDPPAPVGSLRVQYDGNDRVENFAPYSLAGDSDGSFTPANFQVGTHTLKLTPYSQPNLGGTAGASTTISFVVVDNPVTGPPVLLSEQNSDAAIALNATTFARGPFSTFTQQNFSSDKRTRVMFFVTNFTFSSNTAVYAENSALGRVNLPIEHIGPVPGFDWLTQITVVLPDGLGNAGDVWVNIVINGTSSNQGRMKVKPSGVAVTMPPSLLKLLDDPWLMPRRPLLEFGTNGFRLS